MPLRFHKISVPISIVLATAYFYWVTNKQSSKKGGGGSTSKMKDLEITVREKPSSCNFVADTGDLVHVHYTGYLKSNGKQFATSRDQPEPYVFKLGTCNDKDKFECIKGFEGGVKGMCVGEKRKVTMPPHLAFGKKGRGKKGSPDEIPGSETLVFNIEMV